MQKSFLVFVWLNDLIGVEISLRLTKSVTDLIALRYKFRTKANHLTEMVNISAVGVL